MRSRRRKLKQPKRKKLLYPSGPPGPTGSPGPIGPPGKPIPFNLTGTKIGRLSSTPTKQKGNDIIFVPGKGDPGQPNGRVIIRSPQDDSELLSINGDHTITLLGETFELSFIRDLLVEKRSNQGCKCPLPQLMYRGCTCGGK